MQLVPSFVKLSINSLVLDHQLFHFFLPFTHFAQAYLKFLSQLGLAIVLFSDGALVVNHFPLFEGKLFFQLDSVLIGFKESLLYEGDVGFKFSEVLSEVVDFFLKGALASFGVAKLHFEGVDGA